MVAGSCRITVNGRTIAVRRGELLLDGALKAGLEIPHDCRAGHCGTCCVRLVSGKVRGGKGAEPGVVHACQCRVEEDAVFESGAVPGVRTVSGVLASLRALSAEVMEVGIRTDRALPHHPGQYARLEFNGYPSRPFSITLPWSEKADRRLMWFHIRRMKDGQVTPALGRQIKPGHRVKVTGPFGSAYFRPQLQSRTILVGTNTGFAPIWSIAAAALYENPERMMLIVAGGRSIESLYMGPALAQLARFPNVHIVPVCSRPQSVSPAIMQGRPTDFLPVLYPSDVLYACGAPDMVAAVQAIAAKNGAACYADPFLPTNQKARTPALSLGWLKSPVQTERLAV